MFITKVKLTKADKVFESVKKKRREGMAVTFILTSDKRFWDLADWLYMLDNKKFSTSNGFYISANLFKVTNVPESGQDDTCEGTTTT